MPISLLCGACDAALTAPDAAAGKRVKCKKCGAILEVPLPEPDTDSDPDFEVVEEAPTMMLPPIPKPPAPAPAKAPPPAAKPKPKPVMLEVDDDDEDDHPAPSRKKPAPKRAIVEDEDDEEEDRPAPRKKFAKKPALVKDDFDDEDDEPRPKKGKKKGLAKKKAAGSNLPLLIGGGVLGLAVAGFLVWFLAIREPETAKTPTPPAGNNPPGMPAMPGDPGMPGGPGMPGMPGQPPTGWQEFKKPEFTVSVNSTGQPQTPPTPERPGIRSAKNYLFQTQNPSRVQLITVMTLEDAIAAAARQDQKGFFDGLFSGGAGATGRTVARADSQLGGVDAKAATVQSKGKTLFVRGAVVGNQVYLLTAFGDGVTSAEDEYVRTFFDSFKISGQ